MSQTAGAPQSALTAVYEQQRSALATRVATTRRTLDEYLREQAGVAQRIAAAKAAGRSPAKGDTARQLDLETQIEAAREDLADLEDIQRDTAIALAKAQDAAAGKQLTPEEKERDAAETARIRAETDRLKADLANGGMSPLEAENARSIIAAREADLRLRESAEGRAGATDAASIRASDASVARSDWQVASEQAQLPYLIDQTIAQTDLSAAQAARINALLQPDVEQAWQNLYRSQQLLPNEIEQGKADLDLTRQRADELRKTLEPKIAGLVAQNQLTNEQANQLRQRLPYDLAASVAERKLTEAQTGLTGAQTGRVSEETRLAKLQADAEAYRQRNARQLEQWIRANPDASTEQINQVMLGLATDYQDWGTAYRASLDTQIAKSNQQLGIQQNQIAQQGADTDQFAAAERAASEAEANRNQAVGNLPEAFGGTANLSGPQGRFAALAAAGQVGGEAGMRSLASASSWGTTELNGVAEGLRLHLENVKRLQGMGPAGGIRQAPTVAAPEPVEVIGFRPPTSLPVPSLPTAPPPTAPATVPAPTSGVQFTPPGESALRRANRTSTGRIGGV